ncbi:MAG: exopolysaccharide biosynthesis polyprenyl glycosylphosphotransferase [Opitutaceae bacterium]
MTTTRKTCLVLLAFDAAAAILAFNLLGIYRGVPQRFIVLPLLPPVLLLWFATYLIEGYRARTNMRSLDYMALHILALLCAMLATLLLAYTFLPAGYEIRSSRAVIILGFVLLVPLTLGGRHLVGRRIAHLRRGRSLLFIGDLASQEDFREECLKMGVAQPVVYASPGPVAGSDSVLVFSDTLERIRSGRLLVEAIVLRESQRDIGPEGAQALMDLYFGGVPTYPLELFHQVYWQKIPLYRLNPAWLFQQGFHLAREPVFERLKRASDLALAALGLILFSPVLALAAAAIRLEDRGPVFFRQTRVGRYRAPFRAVKLRTMRPGASQGDPYTRDGDARVTRVGRFLRRSRIDEFPQLWNVLRGEMSLIGPRAEWDRLVAEYERRIPCYSYRHLVKPGITGWAQVNFHYGASAEDTVRKLEYDLYYIRHFSFRLDATIVLRTVQIMVFGKGR